MCCSSRFPIVSGKALDVIGIGRRLVPHRSLMAAGEIDQCCHDEMHLDSKASPAVIRDQQMEIRRLLVSTPTNCLPKKKMTGNRLVWAALEL
jgi:hypothetical protein